MREDAAQLLPSPGEMDRHRLVVTTDLDGALVIAPEGTLDDELSQTLLQVLAAAASAGMERITVDLRGVMRFDAAGVRAVTCCHRLGVKLGRTVGFRAAGRASLRLLQTSKDATDTLDR